jgi:hypothetical protein
MRSVSSCTGAVAFAAVALHGCDPVFFLSKEQTVADPLIDREPDREPHAAIAATVDELMGRAGGVGADQHLNLVRRNGELRERTIQGFEMIRRVVRSVNPCCDARGPDPRREAARSLWP